MSLLTPHKESLTVVSVAQAHETVQAAAAPLDMQALPVDLCLGRVVAQPPLAALGVPRFDNSAMDGYALRASDTAAASPGDPARLTLAAFTPAGHHTEQVVQHGQAVRVMTGAPLPPGADAVVKQEDVVLEQGWIDVTAAVPVGNNVRRAGEVAQAGREVLPAGAALNAAAMGWLWECGVRQVYVHRLPRVAVVTTGDEVVEKPEQLGPASILNSNLHALRAALLAAGFALDFHAHAPDDPAALRACLDEGLKQGDVLLITGGVSVGTHDYVAHTLAGLGVETLFHGVKQKPGKPMLFGRQENKLVFGLPGNPASALTGFYVYVRPALKKLAGFQPHGLTDFHAPLAEAVKKSDGRDTFIRARLTLDGQGRFSLLPLPQQGSHMLRSFALANALALVQGPPGELAAGASVIYVPLMEE